MKSLVVNSPNYKALDNGVVISIQPRGIIFAPCDLELHVLEIDPEIQEIHPGAFIDTQIEKISFPPSLEGIYNGAILSHYGVKLEFRKGTELEFLESHAITSVLMKY